MPFFLQQVEHALKVCLPISETSCISLYHLSTPTCYLTCAWRYRDWILLNKRDITRIYVIYTTPAAYYWWSSTRYGASRSSNWRASLESIHGNLSTPLTIPLAGDEYLDEPRRRQMSGWRAAFDDPRDQLHLEIHACWGEEGGGEEEDVSRVRQVAF